MTNKAKLYAGNRTVDSVAYDLALALASKDPSIDTPEALLEAVIKLLPTCKVAAKEKEESQAKLFF